MLMNRFNYILNKNSSLTLKCWMKSWNLIKTLSKKSLILIEKNIFKANVWIYILFIYF